jgi:hypothetical protein
MRKFEQWSCVQDESAFVFLAHRVYCILRTCLGPDERNDLAGACSEVSHMFVDGLRKSSLFSCVISPLIHCPGYIMNKPIVKMEYVKYDFAIREMYGIQIVGLLPTSSWCAPASGTSRPCTGCVQG